MTSEQFGQTYLQYEPNITKVLRKQEIYDEDLLHDTYIALYLHSRHARIRDFVDTFVSFYKTRYKRRGEKESNYETCDDATMIEKYDRADHSDLAYRERVGKRVEAIIEDVIAHPLPGERNRKRAVKILQLYRDGLTFEEIAHKLKTSRQSVEQQLGRTTEKLRVRYSYSEPCEREC